MVGKIKHGERIPKGRKFIDLWGKGGVRGLQKKVGRRFPKEPVDIFKWENILKWRPDESFDRTATDKDGETLMGRYGTYKQSDSLSAYNSGHYTSDGETRFEGTSFYDRTDLQAEWVERLREIEDELPKHFWIYCVEDEINPTLKLEDISYVEVRYRKKGNLSMGKQKAVHDMEEQPFIFDAARGEMGYPSYIPFIDIWNTGIKDTHGQSDNANRGFGARVSSRKEAKLEEDKKKMSKLELWQPYSDEFDETIVLRDKWVKKLKNIKENNSMTPETKDTKTLKISTDINDSFNKIQSIYNNFLRDLKRAGHKVED
tara:strand:- start:63 stop:1007 length:945 start_codon:yes stop_codon:yes gene_type:complete